MHTHLASPDCMHLDSFYCITISENLKCDYLPMTKSECEVAFSQYRHWSFLDLAIQGILGQFSKTQT